VAAAFLFLVSVAFASYARFNFYYVVAAVLLFALGSRGVALEPVRRGAAGASQLREGDGSNVSRVPVEVAAGAE
jgi:asparagine N-glycosylation enzyme membrane subunit Stt3